MNRWKEEISCGTRTRLHSSMEVVAKCTTFCLKNFILKADARMIFTASFQLSHCKQQLQKVVQKRNPSSQLTVIQVIRRLKDHRIIEREIWEAEERYPERECSAVHQVWENHHWARVGAMLLNQWNMFGSNCRIAKKHQPDFDESRGPERKTQKILLCLKREEWKKTKLKLRGAAVKGQRKTVRECYPPH